MRQLAPPARITTLAAARRLGVTSATIRKYIAEGRLRAKRAESGRHYVTEASVKKLLATRKAK